MLGKQFIFRDGVAVEIAGNAIGNERVNSELDAGYRLYLLQPLIVFDLPLQFFAALP